jgi:hypothetical protein
MCSTEPLTGGGLGTPVGVQSHEMELEAMYIAKLYRGVFAEPDIQYIINPGGTSRTHNALSLGLQLDVTFLSSNRSQPRTFHPRQTDKSGEVGSVSPSMTSK